MATVRVRLRVSFILFCFVLLRDAYVRACMRQFCVSARASVIGSCISFVLQASLLGVSSWP